MSYYDEVYKKRVNFRGDTKKEIITDHAERQFLEDLAESPNAEKIQVNGITVSAIVLPNRHTEAKLSMDLYMSKTLEVRPGAIVDWADEEWFVMTANRFAALGYTKNVMFKTNTRLKFYDDFGVLYNVPAIFVGPLNTVLQDAVSDEANMAIEGDQLRAMIILSDITLKNNKRIMLDGRVWRTVEYDHISNRDIVYISLQEDNFDASRDDLENGIADAFVGKKWTLQLPFSTIRVAIGESFMVNPTILQDGHIVTAAVRLEGAGEFFEINGKEIYGLAEGIGYLTVSLVDNPSISQTVPVEVEEEVVEPTVGYSLVGADSIRWGDQQKYILNRIDGDGVIPVQATFTIANADGSTPLLATGRAINTTTYGVTANDDGKIGNIVVTATHDSESYNKTVAIRSLW